MQDGACPTKLAMPITRPCKALPVSTTRQDIGVTLIMTGMGTTSINSMHQGVGSAAMEVLSLGTTLLVALDPIHPQPRVSVPHLRTPPPPCRPPALAPTTAARWRSSPRPIRERASRPLVLPKRPTTILSCSPRMGQEPVHNMASALCQQIVNRRQVALLPTITARYPSRQGVPLTRPMFIIVTH